MKDDNAQRESGSAYDLPAPSFDEDLARVGRGTPGGELLRRYWHPVAVAAEVKDLPVAIRVLGEDLILFRTPGGRFGLVYPRCCHRGTTLLYGKVEAQGIRCCYHGWLFNAEGRCLEQPCEPGGGKNLERYRQPWYPVEERYGLVFAYLGPLDRKPLLPRYDIFEDLPVTEKLVPNGTSIGSGGPDTMPCNWVQTYENVVDPFHVFILHSTFSAVQFAELMAIRPEISWEATEHGMVAYQIRKLPDGSTLRRVVELVLPTLRIVPDPTVRTMGRGTTIGWTVPIDDTNTRIFTVLKFPADAPVPVFNRAPMYDGKTWFELDAEGHQRIPGDFEAQVGQGGITAHSEEHLVSSDRGVSMFRRMYRQAITAVQDGGDPINVARSPAESLVVLRAGNFLLPATAAA
jgi:phenylpropionate dioxygenase-like ring-hydroxylating dioxygenase large terminal subunit